MELFLLADVGSTYTKLLAVDPTGKIVARASAYTTVQTDVSEGFARARKEIERQSGHSDFSVLACSSAAGGLTMVACGLVPELTGQAARLAVLGAGAKLLYVLGYRINPGELERLNQVKPDMLLLAGGTDGGNRDILLNNADTLAKGLYPLPVIVAGNKDCAQEAADILASAGFPVSVAGNVMPELGELDIEPARESIRDLFLRHIVEAKGMNKLSDLLAAPLMPTPAAVFQGGQLLAEDYPELLLVDVGGATTDVYTFGGLLLAPGMVRRGLKPPREMRTVEADIGMRYSLASLVEQVDSNLFERSAAWRQELDLMLASPDYLVSDRGNEFEAALAAEAVRLAVGRHAGTLERVYSPMGHIDVLRGKDLRTIKTIVGVGGVLVNSSHPGQILQGALAPHPERLMPVDARLLLDSDYILAAAGLLASLAPEAARTLLKNSLISV
ncbi:MAG: MutL protein [Firmicutes bacterium]|nr:MutL protein [Bacillota bacterium]